MKIRRIIFCALALILIATATVPGVIYRHTFEQTTKVYTAAIDATRLEKFFDADEIPDVLESYKESGCTTAVFTEKKGVYNTELIAKADSLGFNIALAPDVTVKDDAGIAGLCEKYNVRYIKLQKSIWKDKTEAEGKSIPVCDVIKKHKLTLVVTETIWQLSNEMPIDYQDYMTAADGNILRTFNSYTKTNVDRMDYPASYYQMYNSAYDRNTRFITVKQLEDEGFDSFENAERTQECVRLFCDKMDSHGFINEGTVSYNGYAPRTTLLSAAAAAVAVLMLALMIDLLSKKKVPCLTVAGITAAALAFGVTFIMPGSLISLYPTLFATLAPCFCITAVAVYINKAKKKLGFIPLLLSAAAITVVLFILCGCVITSLLAGTDNYLNNVLFRGVKLSLVVPIMFMACLIFASVYKKRTVTEYKQILKDAIGKIRWYHIAAIIVFLAVGAVYVIRSGNVNRISFTEAYLRNLLTEYFTARPRTKEILIGWPCFTLFIYYAKKNRAKLLQWIFALGASILFASSINTFCHVFTMTETMFMRIITGLLFGAVISAAVLAVNALINKIVIKKPSVF